MEPWHAGALWRTPSQYGSSSGGANGGGGVKAIEANPRLCHSIEIGCFPFQVRVIHVADLTPALIVGHDEDDVRAGSFSCCLEGLRAEYTKEYRLNKLFHEVV